MSVWVGEEHQRQVHLTCSIVLLIAAVGAIGFSLVTLPTAFAPTAHWIWFYSIAMGGGVPATTAEGMRGFGMLIAGVACVGLSVLELKKASSSRSNTSPEDKQT